MFFCNPAFRMKTLLVGNFGARNVGDEMILASALEKYPESVVATVDSAFSQRFTEQSFETVEPFPTGVSSCTHFLFNKKEMWKTLPPKINKIVLPGGGLFAIKNKAWWIWGVTIIGLRKMFPNVEIILESQGIDRPKNFFQRFILKQVLKRVNSVTVRDQQSADILLQYGTEAVVVGDAVENWVKGKDAINRAPTKTLLNARAKWKGEWPAADIYLAMTPEDARWVESDFKGEIIFPENVTQTLDIFSSAKTAIGQRLHFLILAHLLGAEVKTLGTPYAQKVEEWCDKEQIENSK